MYGIACEKYLHVPKVLQKLRNFIILFAGSIEHCKPLAKQLDKFLLNDLHYVLTAIFIHIVFNLQICPAICTLFKCSMNVHLYNTRTKDLNFYLNHAGNNIRKNFFTFQYIFFKYVSLHNL